jgi:pantoate kinase
MREFKYRQTFATNQIRLIYPEERSKALALASLESLKELLPVGLNIGENPDLLFNSFNAAIVNLVNLNDDGIQTDTALRLYKRFLHKFCDLEHERSSIVGFIVNSGLSEFMTNRIITETEATTIKTPFNISLGSVVWPVVDPQFAEMLIDSSDETSPHYHEISASWEIGFDDMYLAIGSRDLSEAEIITDENKIAELKKYLKIYEGEGKTNENEPIYRVIAGDAIPLGIGYTTSPAAAVKGVIVTEPKDIKVKENKEEVIQINTRPDITTCNQSESVMVTLSRNDEKEKKEKIISQEGILDVKNNSVMKLTTIEDITEDSLKELSAAAVRNFLNKQISDKIDEGSLEYAEKLEVKEKELQEKKEAAEAIQTQFEQTKKELELIAKQLEEEKATRLAEKAQADFNSRMSDLESKYELGEKELAVVAKNIRELDDEKFGEWLSDFEVLQATKKKNYKKDEEEEKKKVEAKKEDAKASAEDVLDETKEEEKETPPNTPSIEKNVRDEFADAFKLEDFKINVKKIK